MNNYAVWAQMEARPGKEYEVEELPSLIRLRRRKTGEPILRGKPRRSSSKGPSKELFERDPEILQLNILAAKAPGASGVQGETEAQRA